MSHENPKELTVAIAGLGAIGLTLARRLDQGIEGLRLTAAAARDHAKAEGNMATLSHAPPLVALAELAERAEVVVDCAPAACFRELAEAAVERGRILVTVSGGALLSNMDLVERAKETGARIVVPTGALLGLDAVQAAAQGEVERVTLVTRKLPAAWPAHPTWKSGGSISTAWPSRSRSSRARPARGPGAFRPTSTWPPPSAWPASARTPPGSRSGPTPR